MPDKGGYVFGGWYNEKGQLITADSTVSTADGKLTAHWHYLTIVVKQKINVSSYFAEELAAYQKTAQKPKFKYVVYTEQSASSKIQKGSVNKLGAVAAKTGLFTAKKSGVAKICLSTYDASTKKYVDGEVVLYVAVEKASAVKQTMTYAGQEMPIEQLISYEYLNAINNMPNVAKLTYSSTKPDVVKVDSGAGTITALKTGTSKIKAVFTMDTGTAKPSVVTVNVSIAVKIPKFAKAEVVLKQGKAKKVALKNTVKGEVVTWSSDQEKVAAVDGNGKVTALSAGTAKITATVKNLDGTESEYSYTVKVN